MSDSGVLGAASAARLEAAAEILLTATMKLPEELIGWKPADDVWSVMEILGHSQISMTTRYTHVLPDVMTTAADRIGEALWGSS